MLEQEGVLFIMAEVSIGLAGFTGIVAALQGRDGWHPLDVMRVVSLITQAFGTLTTALFPLGLHSAGVSAPLVWQVSSGVAAFYGIAAYVFVIRRFDPHAWSVQRGALVPVMYVMGVVIMALHLLNATAVVGASFTFYFFGMLTTTAMGCLQFSEILILRPEPKTRGGAA